MKKRTRITNLREQIGGQEFGDGIAVLKRLIYDLDRLMVDSYRKPPPPPDMDIPKPAANERHLPNRPHQAR